MILLLPAKFRFNPKHDPKTGQFATGSFNDKQLIQFENGIKNNDYETGAIFDSKTGKLLVVQKGDRESVKYLDKDVKLFVGNIMTHNHPIDASLSVGDLTTFRRHEVGEMRVVTSTSRYSIKPPINGWGEVNEFTIRKSFDKHYMQFIKDSYKKGNEYLKDLPYTDVAHSFILNVSKDTGIRYTRTKL
mgnify:CR=1 FL=1